MGWIRWGMGDEVGRGDKMGRGEEGWSGKNWQGGIR